MSRPDADDTFHTVEGRYQKWNDANPRPRSPSAIKMPEMSDAAEKTVGMAAGFGAGVVLLLLAVFTFINAGKWGEVERSGGAGGLHRGRLLPHAGGDRRAGGHVQPHLPRDPGRRPAPPLMV